jgi:drug/metabolite transporter (DMT)-like permease
LAVILVVLKKSFNFSLVKKNLISLSILGFFLGLHFIFFISAVKDTTILNATVLVNTTPIFSVLISIFFLKLKPSHLALAGLIISFIGVCIIAYAETVTANTVFSPSLRGDLEAVLASLVEAIYLNYGMKVRSKMDILSIMIPIYLLTAVTVGVLGLSTTGKVLAIPSGAEIFLLLLGLGIMPTAIAHTLYFSSLLNLKSFETATMALLEPIGATILGILFIQEIPAYIFVLGAALILLGIFFVIKEKK